MFSSGPPDFSFENHRLEEGILYHPRADRYHVALFRWSKGKRTVNGPQHFLLEHAEKVRKRNTKTAQHKETSRRKKNSFSSSILCPTHNLLIIFWRCLIILAVGVKFQREQSRSSD